MSNTFSEDRNQTQNHTPAPPEGQWLKLNEACRLLGISEITLRRRVRAGLLPHQFQNGKYYVWVAMNQLFQKAAPAQGAYQATHAVPAAPYASPMPHFPYPPTASSSTHSSALGPQMTKNGILLSQENLELKKRLSELETALKNQQRTIEDQQTLISFLEQERQSKK